MERYNPLLGPVIALVGWSIFMLIWVMVTRLPAIKKAGIDLGKRPGGRGNALDGVLPDQTQWKAHNYNHLMENPTIFYAITLALVAMDDRFQINLALAWGYVALRVLHSLWQATVNTIPVRLGLFILSNICLLGLTIHASARLIHG